MREGSWPIWGSNPHPSSRRAGTQPLDHWAGQKNSPLCDTYSKLKMLIEWLWHNSDYRKYLKAQIWLQSEMCKSSLVCCAEFGLAPVSCSTPAAFTRSSQTRQTTWATDWPATRRTTRSPTPPPSTLLSPSCLSSPTTRKPPQPPAAAPAPPPPKIPSLLPRTPRPSSNTPRCRGCRPRPREWRRTPSPRSSTSEAKKQKTKQENLLSMAQMWTFALRRLWFHPDKNSLHCLHRCGRLWKSNDNAACVFVCLFVFFILTITGWVMFNLKILSTEWIELYLDVWLSMTCYFTFVKKKMKKEKAKTTDCISLLYRYPVIHNPLKILLDWTKQTSPFWLNFLFPCYAFICACTLYHACFSLTSKKNIFIDRRRFVYL